jgi:uncharacterized protein YidB (DUF937 family)
VRSLNSQLPFQTSLLLSRRITVAVYLAVFSVASVVWGGALASGGAASAPTAPGPLGGGLGGLLDQLKQAGLGDKVDSWVGQGSNHQIEPGQLGDALGQKTLSEIAAHAGIDQQELLNQLSQVLPGLVDKLTTNGQVPDTNELSRLLHNR